MISNALTDVIAGITRRQRSCDTAGDACRLDPAHRRPRNVVADGATCRDFHDDAVVVLIAFVMHFVLGRAHDELANHAVLDAAINTYNDRLVYLVADDRTNQRALTLDGLGSLSCVFFTHITVLPSRS